MNVPIGLAAVVVGWRRLPLVEGHPVPRPDAIGALLITLGTAAVTLGLVQGNTWGWSDWRTVGVLALAVVALASFVARCLGHDNPLVSPELFRVRSFRGASVVSVIFSVAFGAMLLSRVLWCQDVWGWSALETGLAIAPGPAMVPIFSFLVASRMIRRWGPGPTVAVGSLTYAVGTAWWALAATVRPDYLGDMVGGMLLTGVGVGLTLPTFMAAGAASLPADSLSTGSAVINMLRQVGLAVGVAIFVALLGTPSTVHQVLRAYQLGWWVLAGVAVLAAVAGVMSLPGSPVATPATQSPSGTGGRMIGDVTPQ